MHLGSLAGPAQTQLGGFKMRAVRSEAPTQRHLYTTDWVVTDHTKAAEHKDKVLVITQGDSIATEAPRQGRMQNSYNARLDRARSSNRAMSRVASTRGMAASQ